MWHNVQLALSKHLNFEKKKCCLFVADLSPRILGNNFSDHGPEMSIYYLSLYLMIDLSTQIT